MARITTTHRITGRDGEAVTAAELRDFLTGLPDDARITVAQAPKGSSQMDPGGEWSLTASELPRPAKQQPVFRDTQLATREMAQDTPPVDPDAWMRETGFTRGGGTPPPGA